MFLVVSKHPDIVHTSLADFFLCSTSWGSSRADLVGFSWRSSCAPRSLAAFSPQEVQILVQVLRKGKMCCAAGFCNNCQSCMHAFFHCAAFFCCFVWISSMDIKRSPFFFGRSILSLWGLKLGAFSDARCKMTRGRRWNGGPLEVWRWTEIGNPPVFRGELLVLGSGIAVTRWSFWNR